MWGVGERTLEKRLAMFRVNPRVILLLAWAAGCSPASPPAPEGKSVPELLELLGDGQPTRRAQAAYALGQQGPEAHAAVPELARALRDDDLRVRIEAAKALGQIGPAAAPAVPALVDTLSHPDAALRRQTAMSLGRIGPEASKALPALEKARRDEAPIVRQAAEEAIRNIRRKP